MRHHGSCALGDLLGRLEEEHHIAAQGGLRLGQEPRRTQEAGGVEVMATGVHHPGGLRADAVVRGLLLGNGVDICPERHGTARLRPPQDRHGAGLKTQLHLLQPQLCQLLLDDLRGSVLLEGELWMAVEILLDCPKCRS